MLQCCIKMIFKQRMKNERDMEFFELSGGGSARIKRDSSILIKEQTYDHVRDKKERRQAIAIKPIGSGCVVRLGRQTNKRRERNEQ